jgi:hypothetical protein
VAALLGGIYVDVSASALVQAVDCQQVTYREMVNVVEAVFE